MNGVGVARRGTKEWADRMPDYLVDKWRTAFELRHKTNLPYRKLQDQIGVSNVMIRNRVKSFEEWLKAQQIIEYQIDDQIVRLN